VLAERRARRLGKSATRTNGPRYDGAQPWRTLYVSTATLNWMRCGMRSQCRLISASDTWSERRKPKISRAAAFKTDCRRRDTVITLLVRPSQGGVARSGGVCLSFCFAGLLQK